MPTASKPKPRRATSPAADARRCAAAMLEGLPPVMWFIRRQMRQNRTCGLSVPQFRALALLSRNPTASLSLVAEHLGSSQPSASRLITGLVARDLVTRCECPQDRRQISLVLTARGRAVLDKARAATRERLAEELLALSDVQRRSVCEAMHVLFDVFGHRPHDTASTAAVIEDQDSAG